MDGKFLLKKQLHILPFSRHQRLVLRLRIFLGFTEKADVKRFWNFFFSKYYQVKIANDSVFSLT